MLKLENFVSVAIEGSLTADAVIIRTVAPPPVAGFPEGFSTNGPATGVSDSAIFAGNAGDYFHAVLRYGTLPDPLPDGFPVDQVEIVRVHAISADNTLTAIRGVEGTDAVSWHTGATLTLVPTASDMDILTRTFNGNYLAGSFANLGTFSDFFANIFVDLLTAAKVRWRNGPTLVKGNSVEIQYKLPSKAADANEENRTLATLGDLTVQDNYFTGAVSAMPHDENDNDVLADGTPVPVEDGGYPLVGGEYGDVVHCINYGSDRVLLATAQLVYLSFLFPVGALPTLGEHETLTLRYTVLINDVATPRSINLTNVNIKQFADDSGVTVEFDTPGGAIDTLQKFRLVLIGVEHGHISEFATPGVLATHVLYADRINVKQIDIDNYNIFAGHSRDPNTDDLTGKSDGFRWINTSTKAEWIKYEDVWILLSGFAEIFPETEIPIATAAGTVYQLTSVNNVQYEWDNFPTTSLFGDKSETDTRILLGSKSFLIRAGIPPSSRPATAREIEDGITGTVTFAGRPAITRSDIIYANLRKDGDSAFRIVSLDISNPDHTIETGTLPAIIANP